MIFSLFFLVNNLNQLKIWWQAEKITEQKEQEIADLESQYQEAREKKEYVQTSDFVQKEAREKLGLAQPNQIKIIVPDWESIPTPAPAVYLPNWRRWGKLFHF